MNKEMRIPNLVSPDGKPVCPVEIDVDSLSSEEEMYQYGGWEDLIQEIAAQWVKINSYSGTGTIWSWGTPSINFHRQSYSAFYAVLGMPKNFREYLGERIRVLGKYVRVYSDYVVPNEEDGWAARCHIEDGKVWIPLDDVWWREVKTEEDEEDTDEDGDERLNDENQAPEKDVHELDSGLTNAEIRQMMHAASEEDVHELDSGATMSTNQGEGPHRRRVRGDARVGTVIRRIEDEYGLPEGSVVLQYPDRRRIRADARINRLRRQWEEN